MNIFFRTKLSENRPTFPKAETTALRPQALRARSFHEPLFVPNR
jgi:hypothetical protein